MKDLLIAFGLCLGTLHCEELPITATATAIGKHKLEVVITNSSNSTVVLSDPSHGETLYEVKSENGSGVIAVDNQKSGDPFWKHVILLTVPREEPPSYGELRYPLVIEKVSIRDLRKLTVTLWLAKWDKFSVRGIAAFESIRVPVLIESGKPKETNQ